MTRSELAVKLSEVNPALGERAVEAVVTHFFDEITGRLTAGGRVELRGFGIFETRARGARTAHHPRTGQPVAVQAKHVPHFKPGKVLRERLISSQAVPRRRG